MAKSLLSPIDSKLLFSRGDRNDPRLGDITKLASLESALKSRPEAVIVGYPDDEGIRLNGGRVGAGEAPSRIRGFFYRMTPPAFLPAVETASDRSQIMDIGDLKTDGQSLEARHDEARKIVLQLQEARIRTVSFGGGHDYGFADAAAYCEVAIARGERPLVINFDAHLDVRPLDRGFTSGTPFFRLLEKFPTIDFVELGLQSQCNSRAHVEWLRAKGGMIFFEEERRAQGLTLTETLLRLLGDRALSKRSAFLSVDIDGFTSAVAPGASQSWPTGFEVADFFHAFSWCLNRFDVRGTGIYEVSPALDVDDRTSRLAALIAHRFVFQL